MLVITRYVVAEPDAVAFLADARTALAALAARPGYRDGAIGRATDDAKLWVLTTRWEHVGAYRRALSAYEVKVHAVPLLSRAIDEASAFEVLAGGDGPVDGRTRRAADADTIGPGRASAAQVPTDLD